MSTQNAIQKKTQHLLKLIIIGDCGVGKTNILMRYCENTFKPSYVSTIGVDFKIKTIQVDGVRIKFQIWDTAGQQRYRNIAQTYYKGAAGIILTYSVTDQNSFHHLQNWMKQINEHAPSQVVKLMIGNKIDANEDQREIKTLQGKTLADKYQIPFIEGSAKTGQNIVQAFQIMSKQIIQKYLPNIKTETDRMHLDKEKVKSKSQCNC